MKDGKTQSQIAKLMNRHKSTISREIGRNTGNRGYRSKQACLLAEERSLGSRNASQITATDWGKAVDCLLEQWSPVQIANQVGISHETIYRHVYADKAAGGSLYQQLRCQKKRKKRYASGRERRGQIVGRRPISERPQHIENRTQVGHWEGDTVIGAAHKQAVVTLVECKSGYALIAKVSNKTSNLVSHAIIIKLNVVTPLVNPLTFDNGKEFAEHARIDAALNSTTYFADPFASWQRGSNENFNGLLRQYIPKKRPLSTVTDKELRVIQDRLNNRPRKRLGFKTPNEVFMQSLNRVALRVCISARSLTHLFLSLIAVISISYASTGFAQTCAANQSIVNESGSSCINYSNSATNVSVTNEGAISQSGLWSNGNAAVRNTGSNFSLTNSGLISAGFYGIYSMGIIESILNTGSITGISGIAIVTGGMGSLINLGNITTVDIYTYFSAYLTTLNNLQGGNASSTATTALRYSGALPTNYNIIIRSPNYYGQLAITSPSGSTTFGIYSGGVTGVSVSTLAKGTYSSVLSGITSSNLTGVTSGNYNGFTWVLSNSSETIWDLIVTGASTGDTQQSLVNTASALQNTFTLQNTVIANSFSYDCNVFGANNVCVSAGGRNTGVSASNGLNNTSALIIAAYRVKPTLRIGAYADQNLSVSNPGGTVNLGNNTPLIGFFGAWNERLDGAGMEIKVSAAYGSKNTTVNRQVVGTSEAGTGSSQLNSQGAQVTAKYGFAVAPDVLVSPYVGMRYTQNNMRGYTEGASSSVTAPLTYSALNTNATTAMAGVGASYRSIPKATLFASAGVEIDTNTSNGTYSASGITGLTPVNFNPNPVKTRPTATLGAYYDIVKNQRIGITGIYRQEAYQAISTTTVLATYTIAL